MSNKIVDGVELLRMIRDGELKANTKINYKKTKLYFDGKNIIYEEGKIKLAETLWDRNFAIESFEILSEEDTEIDIDIDSIEEIIFKEEVNNTEMYLGDKIDELIKGLKQLNKKIGEK